MSTAPDIERSEQAYTTAQSAARVECEYITAELKRLQVKAAAFELRLSALVRLETLLEELRTGLDAEPAAIVRPVYAPSTVMLPHRDPSGLAQTTI